MHNQQKAEGARLIQDIVIINGARRTTILRRQQFFNSLMGCAVSDEDRGVSSLRLHYFFYTEFFILQKWSV